MHRPKGPWVHTSCQCTVPFPRMFAIQPVIQVRVARCLFRGVGTDMPTIFIHVASQLRCAAYYAHVEIRHSYECLDCGWIWCCVFHLSFYFCDDRELQTQHVVQARACLPRHKNGIPLTYLSRRSESGVQWSAFIVYRHRHANRPTTNRYR